MNVTRAHGAQEAAREPIVYRSQSAWIIEWGSFRMGRYRMAHQVIENALPQLPAMKRFRSKLKPAAASIGAFTVIAAPLYLTQASAVTDPRYAVVQRVPDIKYQLFSAPYGPGHSHHRSNTKKSVVKTMLIPASTVASIDGILNGKNAIALALQTGEPQDWIENGFYGVIVPGEPQESHGLVCRSMTRLTRKEGRPNTVDQLRRCSAGESLSIKSNGKTYN